MMTSHYFFVSYSRHDSQIVRQIIHDLKKYHKLNFWIDYDSLNAGDDWVQAISIALNNAIGLVVFISKASMDSAWVRQEISAVAKEANVPIIPVLLEHVDNLPKELQNIMWLDFSELYFSDSKLFYEQHLDSLAGALKRIVKEVPYSKVLRNNTLQNQIASDIIQQQPHQEIIQNAVFLVHGHDHEFLTEVETVLSDWGIESIILKDQENTAQEVPQNLFAKFQQYTALAKFAIILVTPDDLGTAVREYQAEFEGRPVKNKALQYRSRQNVILEMGFFYGRLGSQHVLVIMKNDRGFHPKFERPSDLDGIMFDEVDRQGKWKNILHKRLKQAGFDLQSPKNEQD
jgi:predicted nucleotide-binding protein